MYRLGLAIFTCFPDPKNNAIIFYVGKPVRTKWCTYLEKIIIK